MSIAIPAIGTGNLRYPRDLVAAASLDEVLAFSKNNPSSTLKEVLLVVYDKDLPSVQAFETEFQSRKRGHPGPPAPPAAEKGKRKRRTSRGLATTSSDPDDFNADVDSFDHVEEFELDPLKPELTIANVTVQIESGNITREVTDAIATISNPQLDVAYGGGVGKAILNAGGTTIQEECSSMGPQLPGSIAITGAGKLQTGKIYHMVPDHRMKDPIKDCIVKCLQKADSNRLTSISFPAVGTGNIQRGAKEVAEAMLMAISKFSQEQAKSLHLVRIVIFQQHMFQVFRNAMQACISPPDGEPGLLSKIVGWLGFGKSGTTTSQTSKTFLSGKGRSYMEIFAGTKQDIEKVVEEIEKDVAEHCKLKVIERDAISKLSKEQTQKIKDLKEKHDVAVTIEASIGRISVRGDAEDVVDVASIIYEILNQQIEEEHTRGVEELVSKNTQWFYYDDDGSLEPYDTSINLQIENAYDDSQNSIIVLIDDARCEIVFKDMKETCLDDGEERIVVRKEIGKGRYTMHFKKRCFLNFVLRGVFHVFKKKSCWILCVKILKNSPSISLCCNILGSNGRQLIGEYTSQTCTLVTLNKRNCYRDGVWKSHLN